jgi:hypothetical protein
VIAPLIYNPKMTPSDHWEEALRYTVQLAILYKVPIPKIHNGPPPAAKKYETGGTYYGEWHPPDKIWVNVSAATAPVTAKSNPHLWSYPGHKTDRTCSGILLHEMGHHLSGRQVARLWRMVVKATLPVTSYEPNFNEAWAESMRIFLGNPDLLFQGRPERFDHLIQLFEVPHKRGWREILFHAPSRIVRSAEKFITEGQKAARRALT